MFHQRMSMLADKGFCTSGISDSFLAHSGEADCSVKETLVDGIGGKFREEVARFIEDDEVVVEIVGALLSVNSTANILGVYEMVLGGRGHSERSWRVGFVVVFRGGESGCILRGSPGLLLNPQMIARCSRLRDIPSISQGSDILGLVFCAQRLTPLHIFLLLR